MTDPHRDAKYMRVCTYVPWIFLVHSRMRSAVNARLPQREYQRYLRDGDVETHFQNSDEEEVRQFRGRAGPLPQAFARVRRVS